MYFDLFSSCFLIFFFLYLFSSSLLCVVKEKNINILLSRCLFLPPLLLFPMTFSNYSVLSNSIYMRLWKWFLSLLFRSVFVSNLSLFVLYVFFLFIICHFISIEINNTIFFSFSLFQPVILTVNRNKVSRSSYSILTYFKYVNRKHKIKIVQHHQQ